MNQKGDVKIHLLLEFVWLCATMIIFFIIKNKQAICMKAKITLANIYRISKLA